MPFYKVSWRAFGTLEIEAVDENDATDLAEDGLAERFWLGDVSYDGLDIIDAEPRVPEGRSYTERDTFWDSGSEGTTDAAV